MKVITVMGRSPAAPAAPIGCAAVELEEQEGHASAIHFGKD
jgi:hypothetical protein